MAGGNAVEMVRRRFTVMAGDANRQSIPGAKPDTLRTNLDVKFVNFIWRERLAFLMGVIRRPRLRAIWIDDPLRASQPAARQQPLRPLWIDFQQLHEPENFR